MRKVSRTSTNLPVFRSGGSFVHWKDPFTESLHHQNVVCLEMSVITFSHHGLLTSLAVVTKESWRTDAGVTPESIYTVATVLAGRCVALVSIWSMTKIISRLNQKFRAPFHRTILVLRLIWANVKWGVFWLEVYFVIRSQIQNNKPFAAA